MTTTMTPKFVHTSDASIHAFLQPDFDAADYLNTALPALSSSSTARTIQASAAVPLQELNTQLQSLLNTLNAHTTRLSNALTQLTDEILRTGGRLAYEVEVLRGDTNSLTDTLENGLKKDIELFIPSVLNASEEEALANSTSDPEYLTSLQILTTVRARLDSVIKTFGDAMAWPLPPSELSTATSSFISVSAPDTEEIRSRERKGKEYIENLRSEISALLASGKDGVETASARIEELQVLAEVWKGTAEEKARGRVVDGLQTGIDDQRLKIGGTKGRSAGTSPARAVDYRYGDLSAVPEVKEGVRGSGYGFLQNLRNLKNDIYMDN